MKIPYKCDISSWICKSFIWIFLFISSFKICQDISKMKNILPIKPDYKHAENLESKPSKMDYKYILTWSMANGDKLYGWSFGSSRFVSEGCAESRCFFTSNRSLLGRNAVHQFDAILFHQRSFTWKDPPSQKLRRNEQHYIHWMMESPAHLQYDVTNLRNLSNFFNWSMSYRADARFPTPYGQFHQIRKIPKHVKTDFLINTFGESNKHLANKGNEKNTTSVAAWFVSNCESKSGRENFVKRLQKYIGVDIYGSGTCSNMTCDKTDNKNCLELLNTKYKFYLALENSLCADYVTEKFWKVLNYNVIPVVLNGANMTNIAPIHSYIDIKDFSNFPEFAEYLVLVSQDASLFSSYFWWRDYYASPGCTHLEACRQYTQAYCSLCEALHSTQGRAGSIQDIYKWWVQDAHCKGAADTTDFGKQFWG